MRTVLVTIDSPERSVDCEVPGDLPITDLIPLLVDVCGLEQTNGAQDTLSSSAPTQVWGLGLPAGRPFAALETVIACGVVDGMRLLLRDQASWDSELPLMHAIPEHSPSVDISPSQATGGIGVRWNRDGLR